MSYQISQQGIDNIERHALFVIAAYKLGWIEEEKGFDLDWLVEQLALATVDIKRLMRYLLWPLVEPPFHTGPITVYCTIANEVVTKTEAQIATAALTDAGLNDTYADDEAAIRACLAVWFA